MMTKKDYIKFADMIAQQRVKEGQIPPGKYKDGYVHAIDKFTWALTDLLESDNPNFDPDRFNNYIEKRVSEILYTV